MENSYNEYYYKNCCGELPYDDPAWLPFFEGVADRIVREINPKTVLDVGCAMGHLVTALRERGVDAYGIDISSYAISKVKDISKPYCQVFSALDGLPAGFPSRYDLVVTIEVAEHLREEECDRFLENLCRCSDQIIFSSTPSDFSERTHYNVQQIEYWAKRFSKLGFLRDLNYSCQYIAGHAVRFYRSEAAVPTVVEDYERYIRQEKADVTAGMEAMRGQNAQLSSRVNAVETELQGLQEFYNADRQELSALRDAHSALNGEHEALRQAHTQLQEESALLQDGSARLQQEHARLQEESALLQQEHTRLQDDSARLQQEHTRLQSQLDTARKEVVYKIADASALRHRNRDLEAEISSLQNSIGSALAQVQTKQHEVNHFTRLLSESETTLNNIYSSRCYRLVLKYYRFREWLLPRDSKRFMAAKILFRLPHYIKQGYLGKLLNHFFRHGTKGLGEKIRAVVLPPAPVSAPAAPSLTVTSMAGICPPHAIPAHTESVDVIICVHNAYEDVKRCIESVYEHCTAPFGVILVDDGSAELTRDYLADIAASCPNVTLIRNEQGKGYTFAANIGLRASGAEYRILLNSDTIVTPFWLDKMIDCAKKDPRTGIVGPLSNTASWQSIPELVDADGDWAHNPLPEGMSAEDFGNLVEKYSAQLYCSVPLLNGFCLMIHQSVIEKIGYFDEETFGPGFAEEDDYNLRAGKAGIGLALADNTYIFHAQSKSYSDARRKELCEQSGRRLREKHGNTLLDAAVRQVHKSRIFEGIRARARIMTEREQLIAEARKKWEGKRILFILPITEAGGGGNVVLQEAGILTNMGLCVSLYNLSIHKPYFEAAYPELALPVIYGNQLEDFLLYVEDFDVVCSTLYTSVKYCDFSDKNVRAAYYVQDYEPYFFAEDTIEHKEAKQSYTCLPNVVQVTKTEWNANEVEKHHGLRPTVIGPSVNIDFFRPRRHLSSDSCIHICAMVRPSSPRRAPGQTMAVLRDIEKRYHGRVSISIFGADPINDPGDRSFFDSAATDFEFELLGKLNPQQMAELLGNSDIFIDLSTFQAMGLTAMEAMASGCAVIVPQTGGASMFARHEDNALIVDTSDYAACVSALERLLTDTPLRERLALRAISDMCSYSPEHSAYLFLKAIFEKEGR